MLYLVATPIGHLQDITQRALEILGRVDLILCEDTRRSLVLLQKYGIQKPLAPFHKFNEAKMQEKILADLQAGRDIALISDAGTPCINDPGFALVQACVRLQIAFTAIPGPCSIIQALLLSGFETARFQFVGFFPRKQLKTLLKTLLHYPGTSVGFESPERLVSTLRLIGELAPLREVAVAREMTKVFEECRRGNALELAAHFSERPPKGEIVLLLAAGEAPEEEMPLEELVPLLQEIHGLSLKEALRTAARLTRLPKRVVYKKML